MPDNDDYALLAANREKRYREAYRTKEARAWVASLTPDQRLRAEKLGLLTPMVDAAGPALNLDSLPLKLHPTCELELEEMQENPSIRHSLEMLEQSKLDVIAAYFARPCKNKALRQHCLCFLLGIGTATKHAEELGLTKQLFDYHALKMQSELDLPNLGNLKSGSEKV